MCTGRVDLAFVLRAFQEGADGVIIGGCWPGECHYTTEGNYDALGNLLLGQKLFEQIGVNPARLRLEWISASEGGRFAEVMSDFTRQLREWGPLGQDDGINFKAVSQLVPYLKLVEREKLRVPTKSEEAYREFFASDEVGRLFKDVIADKLTISQILLLLEQGPLSTGEISERLGLSPSEVSGHMISSSRQGLVSYDLGRKSYALASAEASQKPNQPSIGQQIDRIIDKHQGEASSLIQVLLDVQSEYQWLPKEALQIVSERMGVSLAQIQHIATFYKAFSLVPKGRHQVNICMGTACHVRGAARILDNMQELTGIKPGETDVDLKFSLETVNCLGCCALGPVVEINGKTHGKVSTADSADVLTGCQ